MTTWRHITITTTMEETRDTERQLTLHVILFLIKWGVYIVSVVCVLSVCVCVCVCVFKNICIPCGNCVLWGYLMWICYVVMVFYYIICDLLLSIWVNCFIQMDHYTIIRCNYIKQKITIYLILCYGAPSSLTYIYTPCALYCNILHEVRELTQVIVYRWMT